MEENEIHSKLLLEIEALGHGIPVGLGKIEVQGCKECLVELLTHALLTSPAVKDLFNRAARAANEKRSKAEKKPTINPNLN